MNLTVMQDGSEQIHYRDPSIPIYVSRGNLKTFPGMAALCHWHEDVEFLLALEGHLSYSVNGRQIRIPQGNAIFVNARQMHYGFSADGSDCQYICITFRPQLLCANEEIKKRYVLPIVSNPHFAHTVLDPSIAHHQAALSAIRQIDALNQKNPPGFELQETACIFILWQALYQLSFEQLGDAARSDAHVSIQKQMLEYIRIHYPERITLHNIASSGGVCRTKCCQLFKKHLNRTPNDYLNSFRLEKGMELLKSTDMTISEIAGACGFSSASYFTEMFTRQKGLTPTAYRRSC